MAAAKTLVDIIDPGPQVHGATGVVWTGVQLIQDDPKLWNTDHTGTPQVWIVMTGRFAGHPASYPASWVRPHDPSKA